MNATALALEEPTAVPGQTISINPATGEWLGATPEDTADDAGRAARAAQPGWAALPISPAAESSASTSTATSTDRSWTDWAPACGRSASARTATTRSTSAP